MLVLLCALGPSSGEAATCLVDAALGNDGNMCCTTPMPCLTIQAAVTQAAPNDTISVAAGIYPEAAVGPLSINKTLTLLGAQSGVDARTRAGAESIIMDSQGTSVSASGVVIDGFTIQDSTNVAFTGYGIWLNPGVGGTQILNNIFQNNIIGLGIANTGLSQLLIRHNLFQNNNQSPGVGASGTGIYTDQFVGGPLVTDVLIEENDFKGNDNSGIDLSNTCSDGGAAPCAAVGNGVFSVEVRFNTFDMNGRAFDIFNTHGLAFHHNDVTNSTLPLSAALRIFDGNSDISILNNNLIGGVGHGIRLSNLDILGPSSTVEIHLNNITPFDLDGLVVDPMSHVNSVNATCNWWGSATGPFNTVSNPGGMGEPVVGDAIFDCWLIAEAPEGPCCLPPPPDLMVIKTLSGRLSATNGGTYIITVTNIGGPTVGPITVSDPMPAGLTLVSAMGTDWDCSASTPANMDCTYIPGFLGPQQSAPPITLLVSVDPGTAGVITNVVTVTTPDDANPENNQDSVADAIVLPAPAPLLSASGLAVGVGLLLLVAGFGLRTLRTH